MHFLYVVISIKPLICSVKELVNNDLIDFARNSVAHNISMIRRRTVYTS